MAHIEPSSDREGASLLRALRDEIRLQIHLASLDLKDRWNELDLEIERTLGEAESSGRTISKELIERVRALRSALPHLPRPGRRA